MNKIYVFLNFGDKDLKVGELYVSEDLGRHVFRYENEFITSGLQISPLHLPLESKTFIAHKNNMLYDLHGVFSDSLPDTWGKKVQDTEFQKIGIFEPTTLERLAFIGKNGIGALRYKPAQSFLKGNDLVHLAELRKATQSIIEGNVEDVSEQLLKSGGSAGGARPKFLVDVNPDNLHQIRYTHGKYSKGFIPVILKVPNIGQELDHFQRIEYTYFQLAKLAGISIPDCYLISGDTSELTFFAIQRFDILPNNERLHVHSLAGLLNIDFRERTPDCSTFLRTIDDVTRDHRYVVEGYRRIVFNYLGSNKDDHSKNFSFLMNKQGVWALAPAYDIGFSKGENDLHQMRLGDKSRNAEKRDFCRLAEDFDIGMWESILEKTISSLEKWPSLAAENGVPSKYIEMIQLKLRGNIRRIEKG